MPKVEGLRGAWLDAPELAAQRRIAAKLQAAPWPPVGRYFQPWTHGSGLSGVLKGVPLFWNVQKT